MIIVQMVDEKQCSSNRAGYANVTILLKLICNGSQAGGRKNTFRPPVARCRLEYWNIE